MAGSMRQLEAKIYNKLQNDFPDEIQVLEQGVNAIVRYAMLVNELAPCQGGSSSLEELLNASGEDKRISTQIMLLNHSVENMMASRLLLLTGHLGPAMACLRTSFEAFHNAHICSVLEEQATNFLIGKQIDKKVDIDFPIQLKDEKVKEIKRILSDVGVHAKYKALENQGYFEGAIFHDEHKATYEFLVYRCLFSYYSVQLDLIGYFAGQWPRLAHNVPNIVEVTKNLKKRMNNTIEEVKKRAEN